MPKTVFVLTGPTGSGKTGLSLPLAEKRGMTVLCMDSMQVYRGMDIGTAKPTKQEQARVKHRLLDIADPVQPFSVAAYREAALNAIREEERPLLVGGTGLYLDAVMNENEPGGTEPDEALRARLHAELALNGPAALHEMLREKDPETAAGLHPNDTRRVIRALEVVLLSGRSFSAQRRTARRDLRFVIFEMQMDRTVLYERIDRRVDDMLRAGLMREVDMLLQMGVTEKCTAMQGIGYKEMAQVLMGRTSQAEAEELVRKRSRHYAKRQQTWFKRYENAIRLNGEAPFGALTDAVERTMDRETDE